MRQVQQWERSTSELPEDEPVREIVKKERAASRQLVNRIYREHRQEAMRAKIARFMGDRNGPWYALGDKTSPDKDSIAP